MEVLVDTNFLMDVVNFKIDLKRVEEWFGKCEFVIASSTKAELEELATQRGKRGAQAKAALSLLKAYGIRVLYTAKQGDSAVLSLARGRVVATNDKQLRKRLHQLGIRTIFIRAKKHLAMI